MPTNLFSCLVVIASYSPPDCRLEDVRRFPPANIVEENVRMCRQYISQLESANGPLFNWRRDEWCDRQRELKRDAHFRYVCWDSLNAACGNDWNKNLSYRLKYLKELRSSIGDRAYFSGVMPFPILVKDEISD